MAYLQFVHISVSGTNIFTRQNVIFMKGVVLSRQGKVEEALEAWELSNELDANLIDGRFSRAFLLKREGRLEEAKEEWKKIILFLNRHDFDDVWPKQELEKLEAEIRKG